MEKIDDILARKQTKAEEQEQEKEQEQTVCFTKEDNKEQKENYIECLETKQSLTKGAICFRPWKQIATTVAGKLRPECMCLEDIGDVHNCENFEDLWNNNIMQEYREKMVTFNQQWCCDNCKNNIVSKEHKKFTCW